MDALNGDDAAEQKEEIGDVLMNVLMILEIHSQDGDFDALDAVNDICEKLYRRHPHVFTSSVQAKDASEVRQIWDKVKQDVGAGRTARTSSPRSPRRFPGWRPPTRYRRSWRASGSTGPTRKASAPRSRRSWGR